MLAKMADQVRSDIIAHLLARDKNSILDYKEPFP
jgi:hypothetical protein